MHRMISVLIRRGAGVCKSRECRYIDSRHTGSDTLGWVMHLSARQAKSEANDWLPGGGGLLGQLHQKAKGLRVKGRSGSDRSRKKFLRCWLDRLQIGCTNCASFDFHYSRYKMTERCLPLLSTMACRLSSLWRGMNDTYAGVSKDADTWHKKTGQPYHGLGTYCSIGEHMSQY